MNRVRTVRRTHSFSLHLREQINEPLSPPTDFPCNFISPSQFPAKSGLKNNERETYSCAEMSQLSSPSFRRKHRSLDRRVGRKIRSNWQVFNKENYQSFSLVTNVMNGASKHELTRTRNTCTCHRHVWTSMKKKETKKKKENVSHRTQWMIAIVQYRRVYLRSFASLTSLVAGRFVPPLHVIVDESCSH